MVQCKRHQSVWMDGGFSGASCSECDKERRRYIQEITRLTAENKALTESESRATSGWSASIARNGELQEEIAAVTAINKVLGEALLRANRLCNEALPKFNWGTSFLDANAVQLLNEVPSEIKAAIALQEQGK